MERVKINEMLKLILLIDEKLAPESLRVLIEAAIDSCDHNLHIAIKEALDEAERLDSHDSIKTTIGAMWLQSMSYIEHYKNINVSKIKPNDKVSFIESDELSSYSLVANLDYRVDCIADDLGYVGVEDTDGYGLITTRVPVNLLKSHSPLN